MTRPSFENICMQIAHLISQRSTCKRLHVGSVIASEDHRQIYSWGYNGNATGLPNCCDSDEPGKCGCLHSEINSVINCTVPRYLNKIVYVTHLPCINCCKALINLGNVKKVYYDNDYRIKDSLNLFKQVGIECTQMSTGLII